MSAFEPLTPETCASCHNPQQTGGDCLTCHQYHAERPRPARLEALPPLHPEPRQAAPDDTPEL